jgi:microsomal dipeptidase-like Zn-dependent dipeptidase
VTSADEEVLVIKLKGSCLRLPNSPVHFEYEAKEKPDDTARGAQASSRRRHGRARRVDAQSRDHFDHVAKLIGPEHLGVGSDIDLYGYDKMPPELNKQLRAGYKGSYGFREKIDIEGLNHPKRMYDLTEGLIRRKYSDRDIEGVLGGNFARVLAQIWSV